MTDSVLRILSTFYQRPSSQWGQKLCKFQYLLKTQRLSCMVNVPNLRNFPLKLITTWTRKSLFLCSVDRVSGYNRETRNQLMHSLFLVYFQSYQDNSHVKKIPFVVYMRLCLLMMGLDTPETCRDWRNILRISCATNWFFFRQQISIHQLLTQFVFMYILLLLFICIMFFNVSTMLGIIYVYWEIWELR